MFSRSTSKIRFIGVLLLLFGCTGMLLPSSTGIYTQQEVEIENPESVDGIENIKGYNESEAIDISNERITIVVEPEVEIIEITDSSGKRIESLVEGSGYVNAENLSKYNEIRVRTIDENGNLIDGSVVQVNSSSSVEQESYF